MTEPDRFWSAVVMSEQITQSHALALDMVDRLQDERDRLKAELAGSENNRQALAEALDGMQKTLTETQKALNEAQQARGAAEKRASALEDLEGILDRTDTSYKAALVVLDLRAERDTANELLKEAAQQCKYHNDDYHHRTPDELFERIAAHLKPKEER